MERKEIIDYIKLNSDVKYKQQVEKLYPNLTNVLGVKLPILKELAKEIAKGDYKNFLDTDDEFFDETMLKGLVIGKLKYNINDILKYIQKFIVKIDNCSVCDNFCASLKITNKNKQLLWDFIGEYIYLKKEYQARFSVSMLSHYYLIDDYIDDVLELIDNVRCSKSIVESAIATLISQAYFKYEVKITDYLDKSKLTTLVYNKAIHKITESSKITPEKKALLKLKKRP